jgi:hypothetical protein
VNPRKSKVSGLELDRLVTRSEDERGFPNETSRVFSGWSARPNFPKRFGSTAMTRLASSSLEKVRTRSSAYRTMKLRPLSLGFTTDSNHWSTTSWR